MLKRACFFSNEKLESIEQEQYSLQDINILKDLGFEVIIANTFSKIPLNCDLYFSWWASGSILPLIKAKLCSKPIIIVAGGNEVMLYQDSKYGIAAGYLATPLYKKIATQLCLRFASRIIVVSNFMLDNCIKLDKKQPVVVHNSVNVDKFFIADIAREYVTMIFKSEKNVVRLKRGEIFLQAIPHVLKKYPDQKFVVIGNKDNYYPRLKEMILELKIENNIDFVGSIKNEEVVEWMQKSKAYVQISDTETFGVAIAEAMSCGTQVVVSNKGAIPEVVGRNGIYVDHNDSISVSNGILTILDDNKIDYMMKSNEIRNHIVENFSYEIRKEKIKSIIAKLVVLDNE